jgi:hypothetical protein
MVNSSYGWLPFEQHCKSQKKNFVLNHVGEIKICKS